MLKLYTVLCQTAWVTQPGLAQDWSASYRGLLDLGLPRFIKHCASIVVRRDKGYADAVSLWPISKCLCAEGYFASCCSRCSYESQRRCGPWRRLCSRCCRAG